MTIPKQSTVSRKKKGRTKSIRILATNNNCIEQPAVNNTRGCLERNNIKQLNLPPVSAR